MYLSIVIPAYNESQNIENILSQLQLSLASLSNIINDYEVIFCDDHSSDNSIEKIKLLGNPKIKCIRLSRRSGSHSAIRAGLSVAKGDIVLCISADGQDDPDALPQMVQKIKEGKQIVWGVRSSRNESFFNKLFAIWFYKLLRLFVANENNIDLANADFYLLERKVVNAINACPERNTSLFGLIAWIGFKQDEVKYERKERKIGKSKWTFSSKMKLALDWIMAFSGLPLKFITFLGFIISVLGFLYAVFILGFALLGNSIPGWASTTTIILFLGGVQLLMIGILGEYLWRTLDESRNRPIFFIEEKTDD